MGVLTCRPPGGDVGPVPDGYGGSPSRHYYVSAIVGELTRKICDFIDGWNGRAHPFVWTKTADRILTKANRHTTSDADH